MTEQATGANDVDWQKTSCILCECNCGLEVKLDGRQFAKIRGDKEHPTSAGYSCEKPLRLNLYQNGAHRIDTPLRRRPDGTHEPVDWDTALDDIASRLSQIKTDHGGDKIFFYGGGGQGNHLSNTYSRSLRAALGSRYTSNPLAQEKTGEIWVDANLYGGHSKGDFEHSEVVLFLGKNPWQSHSFPRARPTLREIARDPDRAMIVLDPRRSETAEMAEFHLQVLPGTDAWCLAAMLGTIVQEDLVDHEFLAAHTQHSSQIIDHFIGVDVAKYAGICDVDEQLIRAAARRFATASSATTYEDLGTQQAPNSTLVSYLNKLLWIVTGNFGRPGTMFLHSAFAPVATFDDTPDRRVRYSPVTGARIISGLIPCNSVAEEVLTDHPDRFRAMWIDSSNPAHSLVDSATFARALDALEFLVVIDVAYTETARHADYVLPAASQFEKWECTFFNFEFPHNFFQLRPPLMEPLPGTRPEPDIYAEVLRRMHVGEPETINKLRFAAAAGRPQYTAAFTEAMMTDPTAAGIASYLLYETFGAAVPDGHQATASIWGLAQICAMMHPDATARAGHANGDELYDAIIANPQGIAFTSDEWEHVWSYVRKPDNKIQVAIPELIEHFDVLEADKPTWTTDEFPLVLSAGERRSFTANTIYRDPTWRRRDPQGTVRVSHADAERLSLINGQTVRIVTERGAAEAPVEVSDMMRAGHISLPNGYGLRHPEHGKVGVAPNDLTSAKYRDWFAGTPWHKHVPARLEKVPASVDTASADEPAPASPKPPHHRTRPDEPVFGSTRHPRRNT